jgi:hypothetical protein
LGQVCILLPFRKFIAIPIPIMTTSNHNPPENRPVRPKFEQNRSIRRSPGSTQSLRKQVAGYHATALAGKMLLWYLNHETLKRLM